MKPISAAAVLFVVGGLVACAATAASREEHAGTDRSKLTETLSLVRDSATALVGWRTFEQPEYELLQSDGAFELRAYPEMAVVRTADGEGEDAAFGRLFRYLSGENERDAKVAMTAPALMQRGEESTGMVFVLPRRYTASTAPAPSDENVVMETLEPASYATVRSITELRSWPLAAKLCDRPRVWPTSWAASWRMRASASSMRRGSSAGSR